MFRLVVPLHSIGLFIFRSYVTKKGYSVFNIISLAISVCYMIIIVIFPRAFEKTMKELEEVEIKPYSKCVKDNFTNCYWRSNPATKFALEEDIN